MLLKLKLLTLFSTIFISLYSSAQTSCNPSSPSCGAGTGCYPMEVTDMFGGNGQQQEQFMTEVSSHLGSNEPSANGAGCSDDKDCESFSCKVINDDGDKQCVAQYVCRAARLGETLVSGALCDEGLISVNNKCANDENGIYAGLPDGDLSPTQKGVCEFEFSAEKYVAGQRAMYVMRAMEIFFARVGTARESDECLYMAQSIKPIGEQLFERRKSLVRVFNEEWNKIEANISTVMSASDNSSGVVTLFGTRISEKEIARRKALGVDMLEIMRRRALLQKQYENAMLVLYNEAAKKIEAIETEMKNINSTSKQWTIGGKSYHGKDLQCRWGLWGVFNRKVWNRWHHYYEIDDDNTAIYNKIKELPNTLSYLKDVYGSEDAAQKKFDSDKDYYFVDPMLPAMDGTNKFRNYGSAQFLADAAKRRTLSDITSMVDQFKNVAKDHTALIKDSTMFGADKFMYDPDLVKLSAKNCIQQPSNPNCDDFTTFKDRLAETIFGQFLGTSRHHLHKYYSHFANADSGRRRVIANIRASSAVAEEFYKSMVSYRDKQISCLEAQIGKIEVDFFNGAAGLSEGTNYYNPNSSAASNPKPAPSSGQASVLNLQENKKWDLSLTNKILNAINPDNLMKNISPNAGTRGVFLSDDAQAAMAARLKSMKDTNVKSAAAGKNVKEAEDVIRNSILAEAKSISAPSLHSGMGKSMPQLGNTGPSKASESKPDTNESAKDVKSAAVVEVPKNDNKGVLNENGLIGASSSSDPTGMSEEEKNLMMANYDRTKGEYKSKEDDGLFKILSKAYVRSLDRVLKRKKPGED